MLTENGNFKQSHRRTPSVLIIYTGGTIGMAIHPVTGTLSPVKFEEIQKFVPELSKFGYRLKTVTFSSAHRFIQYDSRHLGENCPDHSEKLQPF
jgi:L-asparaginase/Glu-tRNA(Gln) amidotransferase subunit D